MNMVLGIDDLNSKLQIRANLVLTLNFALIFMEFGTLSKSSRLIMNITPASAQSVRVTVGLERLQAAKFDSQSERD